jgi:4-alpha-glucanotransferase
MGRDHAVFNLSRRVSAFLHPNFRRLLWLVGVSLALTAVIIAFTHKSECCWADEAPSTHDHGPGAHHNEHSHHGDQAHAGLTAASVMSFLVPCVPIALAAVISPDRFGETFLRNRGTIESVRLLPGSDAKSAPQPIAEENSVSANSNSNALPSLTDNRVDAASTGPASAEPTLPASDENPEESTAAEYQNPALRPATLLQERLNNKEGSSTMAVPVLPNSNEDPAVVDRSLAWFSTAGLAIAPLQDLLNLGAEARMNLPGSVGGNWRWRCTDEMWSESLVDHLRGLKASSNRNS